MFSLLFLVAAATGVDANSAGLVTEIVTTSIAREKKLDVISGADVRRQLELEADKAVMGCDEKESCLAELANAMGARFIVHGKLGALDDVVILTLNVFDSEKAQAAGRVVVKDKSLSGLSDKVEPATRELLADLAASIAEGTKARVLVLDVEAPQTLAAAAPPESEPLPPLFWAGTGVAAAGAIVAIVGALFLGDAGSKDRAADPLSVPALEAADLYAQRDTSAAIGLSAIGIGGAAVVGGVGTLAYSFVE